MNRINNIVLVHGFWADASCYNKITPVLLAEGYEVFAVQNPLTSLADDAAALRRVLARVEGKCVLVGHSWGGVVITEVGADEKVANLVYLAAIAPDAGESMMDVLGSYEPPPAVQHMQIENGFVWFTKEGFQETFAQDLPPAESALMYATQNPPSAFLPQEKPTAAAWKNKPSRYVVASADKAVSPVYQSDAAKRIGAEITVVEASHVPMLSHPQEVLAVIREAAAQI